ncbi:hypothetical protein ITJ57_06010 [Plantibacter sp. VKM Ac-2880]|uniref:hypothetical protein n=1 Tax=Plantibacter sp. VKM Ac-2880 TaxID=2783827 RepID=UPI001890034B|nr:hypothetical protein [Plantibacter sp. VKM Ac-2880]MBF4568321.1 hypothetical protein [Plantibacter sp. VKM Ac-2880]
MPRADARVAVAAALTVITLGSLTACTPSEEAPAPLPSAVWSSSAPEGPLEGDPWVVAVRASLEAQAVAVNRNDFSLPSLTETTSYDLRSRLYGAARDQLANGATDVLPGPLPFAPVEVIGVPEDETASVRGCVAEQWASEGGTAPAVPGARGIEYRLEQKDGSRVVTATVNVPDLDCSAVELPVALFDPAPEPSIVDDVEQIVRPTRD